MLIRIPPPRPTCHPIYLNAKYIVAIYEGKIITVDGAAYELEPGQAEGIVSLLARGNGAIHSLVELR